MILAAIVQSTILPHVPLLGLIPNLVLLLVVGWSFQRGANEGVIWAMIGGLASDLASGARLGISPVPLMAAALVGGVGYARIFRGNLILPPLITVAAIALYQGLYLTLTSVTSRPVQIPPGATTIGGTLILLHTLLMPLAYLTMGWLARLIEGPRIQLGG